MERNWAYYKQLHNLGSDLFYASDNVKTAIKADMEANKLTYPPSGTPIHAQAQPKARGQK